MCFSSGVAHTFTHWHTLFILTLLTWPYLSTSSLTRDWFSRAKAVEIAWFRLVGLPGRGLRSLSCSVSDTERSQYRIIFNMLITHPHLFVEPGT